MQKENIDTMSLLFPKIRKEEIDYIFESSTDLCTKLISLSKETPKIIVTDISPHNPLLRIKDGLTNKIISKGVNIFSPLKNHKKVLLTGDKTNSIKNININALDESLEIISDINDKDLDNYRYIFIYDSDQNIINNIINKSNPESKIFIVTSSISDQILWETNKRDINFIDQKDISIRSIFTKILEIIKEEKKIKNEKESINFIELKSFYHLISNDGHKQKVESKNIVSNNESYAKAKVLNDIHIFNRMMDENFYGNIKQIIICISNKERLSTFIRSIKQRVVSTDKRKILFLYNYIIWNSYNNNFIEKEDYNYIISTLKNNFNFIDNDKEKTIVLLEEINANKADVKCLKNNILYYSSKLLFHELLSSSNEIESFMKIDDIKVSDFIGNELPEKVSMLPEIINSLHDIKNKTSPYLNQIYFLINFDKLNKFDGSEFIKNKLFSMLLTLGNPSTHIKTKLIENYNGVFNEISFTLKSFAFLSYTTLKDRFKFGDSNDVDMLEPSTVFDIFTKRIVKVDHKLFYSPFHCSLLLDYYRRNDLIDYFETTEDIFKSFNYDYKAISFFNDLLLNYKIPD